MKTAYETSTPAPRTILSNSIVYAIELTEDLTVELCINLDRGWGFVEFLRGGYSCDDVLDANYRNGDVVDYDANVAEAQYTFAELDGLDIPKIFGELVAEAQNA